MVALLKRHSWATFVGLKWFKIQIYRFFFRWRSCSDHRGPVLFQTCDDYWENTLGFKLIWLTWYIKTSSICRLIEWWFFFFLAPLCSRPNSWGWSLHLLNGRSKRSRKLERKRWTFFFPNMIKESEWDKDQQVQLIQTCRSR